MTRKAPFPVLVALALSLALSVSCAPSCARVPPNLVNMMCPPSVTYPVPTALDLKATSLATDDLYSSSITTIRKHVPYKMEHCIEAVKSFACYANYPQCLPSGEVQTMCASVCALAAQFCNVSREVLQCDTLYPSTNCFEAVVIHGPACAVPSTSQLKFCTMVDYNSSRTYHGDDFVRIDQTAQKAFETASQLLPTSTCKELFKLQLCQNYFRKCDAIGNSFSPCATLCNQSYLEGCNGISPNNCFGPQFGPPGRCFSFPIPEIDNVCAQVKPDTGLRYCNMVDYPIDITTNVPLIDKTANAAALGLIDVLQRTRPLSDACKSRIFDFVCGSYFRKCAPNPNDIPLQPCQRFCLDIESVCGVDVPVGNGCEGYPLHGNCLEILPSSRKRCNASTPCPSSEYCFIYDTNVGVCLAKPDSKKDIIT